MHLGTEVCRLASPRCGTVRVCSLGLSKAPSSHPPRRWQSNASRGNAGSRPAFKRLKLDTEPITIVADIPGLPSKPLRRLRQAESSAQTSSQQQAGSASKEDAKFYDFYLNFKLKPHPYPSPGAWIATIELESLRARLSSSFQDRPLDFFAGTSCDLQMAEFCLEMYLALSTNNVSRDEQRSLFKADLPGSRALAWLLRQYDQADLSNNVGFLRPLVHCLVAEDGESHIWDWLQVQKTATAVSSQPWREQVAWRDAVLRFLVESQAFWAGDTEGINPSLRSRARAISFRELPGMYQRSMYIGKASAGAWILCQMLYNGASCTADPDLYDAMLSNMPRWTGDNFQREFNQAQLLQLHPTRPHHLPALELLRRYQDADPRPLFMQGLFHQYKPRETSFMGFAFLIRSAQFLSREGYDLEARWMLDFGRRENPSAFKMRPYSSEIRVTNPSSYFRLDSNRKTTSGYERDAEGQIVIGERFKQRAQYLTAKTSV